MINNVTLIGRLTKEPEIKYLETGNAVCRFTLAVQRNFTSKNGERGADFISCVAWGKTAELIAQYVKKGHKLGITGRIETGSYEKNGTKVYTTDVVVNQLAFLESQETNNTQQPYQQQQPPQQPYPQQQNVTIDQNQMPFAQPQQPQQQPYPQQQNVTIDQNQMPFAQPQQPQQPQQQNYIDNVPPF